MTQEVDDIDFWLSPTLCMGQTCGLQYRISLHDRVGLAGTADYALDDCPPGFYRRVVVVRTDDQRDAVEGSPCTGTDCSVERLCIRPFGRELGIGSNSYSQTRR